MRAPRRASPPWLYKTGHHIRRGLCCFLQASHGLAIAATAWQCGSHPTGQLRRAKSAARWRFRSSHQQQPDRETFNPSVMAWALCLPRSRLRPKAHHASSAHSDQCAWPFARYLSPSEPPGRRASRVGRGDARKTAHLLTPWPPAAPAPVGCRRKWHETPR